MFGDEEILYLRDDDMDEFGDSGAYGEDLEEDYEEEEEEEEEADSQFQRRKDVPSIRRCRLKCHLRVSPH